MNRLRSPGFAARATALAVSSCSTTLMRFAMELDGFVRRPFLFILGAWRVPVKHTHELLQSGSAPSTCCPLSIGVGWTAARPGHLPVEGWWCRLTDRRDGSAMLMRWPGSKGLRSGKPESDLSKNVVSLATLYSIGRSRHGCFPPLADFSQDDMTGKFI